MNYRCEFHMDLGNKVEKAENLVHLRCVHVVTSDMSDFSLCDHMDCSPPGSSVHGILQARILEWVAILFCRGSSQPRGQIHISCIPSIGRQVLYH